MKEITCYILVIILFVLVFLFLRQNTSGYNTNTPPIITCIFTLPSAGSTTFTNVKVWVAICWNSDGSNTGCNSGMVKNPDIADVNGQFLVTKTVVPFTVSSDGKTASCSITLDKFNDVNIPTGTGIKVGIAMITKEGVIGDFEYKTFKLIAPTSIATTPIKTTPHATTPIKTTPHATTPIKTTPHATTPAFTRYIVPLADITNYFPLHADKANEIYNVQLLYPNDASKAVSTYKEYGLNRKNVERILDDQVLFDGKYDAKYHTNFASTKNTAYKNALDKLLPYGK